MRWGFIRHGAWIALVLGIIFIFVRGGRTQDEQASPGRTREALRQAIELYKSQDYDKAAAYFSYVQPMQQALSPTDQQDFVKFSASNAIALKGWQDGTAQIRLAQDALQQGRTKDAGNLLKSLNANQYLSPAERQDVAELDGRLQTQVNAARAKKGKTDEKSLLAQGRAALQAGDLASAEAFANQADKASSLLPTWLQPWNDSPAKLRRDIQTAQAKQLQAAPPDVAPKNPEPAAGDANKPPSTSKFMGIWPFGSSPAATAKKEQPDSERKINEMMARQIVKDGFLFLQANDLEKAQFLAIKAKEMNVAFAPNEQTPDQLLQDIQRHKGSNQPADPIPAQPKPAETPSHADPRALLKQGRTLLEKKKYEEADKACHEAQAGNARWGLF